MPRMVTPFAVQLAPWKLETADRPAWLGLRQGGLGGSDMGAVAGMDPMSTRWRVWLDKVHPELAEEPEDGSRLAELFWFGHQMEDVAARRFRMLHPGTRTRRVGMLASREHPWMRVNLDYLVSGCEDGPCLLEVKNRNAYASREWDADGDAERAPDAAVIQVMHGLMILGGPPAGYAHGHLLAVIGGNELREYRVGWDPALAATLMGEGRWFWHDHVLAKVPPPVDATERTGQILARLWDADPDSIMTASPELVARVDELRAAEAAAGTATAAVTLLKNELMAALGEHEILLAPDGTKLVTWKRNSTFREGDFRKERPAEFKKYAVPKDVTDTQALAAAEPGLYRQYRSRAFRVAPPPKPAKPRNR